MSRYDLKSEKPNGKSKQGVFIIFLVTIVFLIAYQYEVEKGKTEQTVVSKDYEICLQAICIKGTDNSYEECLFLDSPRISNVKVVKVSPLSRNAKRIEIDPLSAKCEDD